MTMSNLTIVKNKVIVNGEVIAVVKNLAVLRQVLLDNFTRTEAVYFALSLLGKAKTSDIANAVGMDRANTTKQLDLLVIRGRVRIVEVIHSGKRGRPTRLWEVIP